MDPRSFAARLTRSASSAGGQLLAAATEAVARVRPSAKPLHPRGEVWSARVIRHGSPEHIGVSWVDELGEDDAVVRLSAAVGLPTSWPDILGMAVRVEVPGGHADLLLATTGSGRLSRFVLLPARSAQGHRHTSLLPYKGPEGPVLFAAEASAPDRFDLQHSGLTGEWITFGELHLLERQEGDTSFDPIEVGPLPGLEHYAWVNRLREPAYRTARRSRAEP
ncbi:hypothetical protein ncot_11450 [Nocardioides sp. JQ2195]|uniref:hypothetical protein n=1 Tax=Nocardioides sp. JQ2195 TaxID=2592334 RepID=UPI00143EA6EA|nr:hypothetical protein [Nocardioides sp. JQ2195]QIX27144.1 hypothetical protein ncot_11450 [Nocardioides sp. JQ2195]